MKKKSPKAQNHQFGATEQNLLKLFGALVDGQLLGIPTIPIPNENSERIIY